MTEPRRSKFFQNSFYLESKNFKTRLLLSPRNILLKISIDSALLENDSKINFARNEDGVKSYILTKLLK